ncbi:hypothetical protein [Herbiconiux daphne]|uniref:Uncharacterized protein n=1 Tax=Herbiconiux daphne TaxID=2970914 RepID=A0ABT2H2X4_9MICO|nr:hypothetical protein [Herbiconiux daphne]MCS5734298.1 hypothetical protein [Herbiconiux daphne]
MTLTNILPSLRRSIPDPLVADRWPEHTVATTTDVVVAGISLMRLVDVCGTPCVHVAAAVVPGTHGRPSPLHDASVVVVRVLSVELRGGAASGERDVVVDGELCRAHAEPTEARLVGRASTARKTFARCHSVTSDDEPLLLPLPVDLAEGDLIALPCTGAVPLRDVRRLRDKPAQA